MPLAELNIASVWWAKQTARGTAATTAFKKANLLSGGLSGNVAMGSEPVADGNRFNRAFQYPESLDGGGAITVQGQTGIVANLLYNFLGSVSTTGTGPYTHTITPSVNGSNWMTFWQTVGNQVKRQRQFNDCRISQLVINAAQDQKPWHVAATVISLDPDVVYTSDPVKTTDSTTPMLYTEGVGNWTINGTTYPVHQAVTVTLGDSLEAVRGEKITAQDVGTGVGTMTLEATLAWDATVQALANTLKYGTATPTVGTKPQQTAPALGSYLFDIVRSTTEEIKMNATSISWSIPDEPDPNPSGGVPTMTLTGQLMADPTFTVKNADATPNG